MSEAPAQIFAAMSAVMGDMAGVGKSGFNKEQGYPFRSIEDVLSAAHAALVKHGVFFLPRVLTRIPEERETRGNRPMNVIHLEIEYTFYAADGSHVASVVWGEGSDMADKSTNKAMSQALKYNLVQALCISAGDMPDSDASAEEAGPRRPQRERFEDAAPARSRQQERPAPVQVPPLAADDPWADKVAGITDRHEGEAAYLEVNGMLEAGTIDLPRAQRLRAVITARVTSLKIAQANGAAAPAGNIPPESVWQTPAPDRQPAAAPARIRQEDQGAPPPSSPPAAADGAREAAEAEFIRDFMARLAAVPALDGILPMQRETGQAVQRKTITPEAGTELASACRKRANELETAAKAATPA